MNNETEIIDNFDRDLSSFNIQTEAIAIVGMACRFPGANNYNEFWKNLEQGTDSITEIPQERWNLENFYSSNIEIPNTSNSKWGGFIEDIDKFDANFFQTSAREANRIDPQQRLMLELSWSCIEDAGYSPLELSGNNVGVFIGVCNFDYKELQDKGEVIEGYNSTGTYTCIIPNRISYFFNFHGPSIPVDTACSSSLVAIHQAVNALNQNECEMALVGGVSVLCTLTSYISFSKLGMLSPEGKCKAFDAKADGYVRGEGAGVILLKPLKKAVEDKNYIYGIVKGSAINHGGHARTLTSPNAYSQSKVVRAAYIKANIQPDTVSYIEAHGTGTPLGDPIEINGLKRAYTQLYQHYAIEPTTENYCGLGSVKTNIGHLESAAGIAGVIKILLAMKYKKLPGINNFQELNPRIKLDGSPFYIVKKTEDWQHLKTKEGKIIPRRAGVSSFGFGGVNAHVILEESPVLEETLATKIERPSHLMTLSAKTDRALKELAKEYQIYLRSSDLKIPLTDICYTANTGRSHFNYRLAIVADSREQLIDRLTAFASGKDTAGLISGQLSKQPPKIAFLFTGQGSQYINMGRQLYDRQPIFRQTIEQCDEILRPYLEHSLLEVLYPSQEAFEHLLDRTAYTQPALFAIEYALYQLWKSWGIEPNVVLGHSVGEYVAACVAGVFSLEDGLKLIAYRGQLMQQLPSGGEMVSLMACEERVRKIIAPFNDTVALAFAQRLVEKPAVGIAAINGPESVVISGASEDIAAICQQLSIQGVKTKRLQVSHAFHSPLMTPMLKEFEQVASQITYKQPQIPLISNVTGKLADENIANAQYWVTHIRQTVRFADSMQTLHQLGYEVFLEVGPKPILLGMGRECLPEGVGSWLPSLRPGLSEWQQLLSSLGELYVGGMAVDWSGFDRDYSRKKVTLPTYQFQRQRYWIENTPRRHQEQRNSTKLHPLLDKKLQLPLSKEIVFESQFSTQTLPFLLDHQVYNQIVVPGACHLSLLLGAADLTFASESCLLENIVFPQALVVPEGEVRTVQLVLSPEASDASFKLISFDTVSNASNQVSEWLVHATGKITKGVNTTLETVLLQEIQTRCTQQITAGEIYQSWQKRQIQYGVSFQWLDSICWKEGEALGKLKLLSVVDGLEKYQLYPGLLDSCLQLIGTFFRSEDTFVPSAIESFRFYQRPQNQQLWCHAMQRQSDNSNSNKLLADIKLFDANGQLIADIKGFEAKKATPNTLLQNLQLDFKENSLENWLYKVEWQPQVRFSNEQLSPDYLPAIAEISRKLQPQHSQLMAEPQLEFYEAAVRELEALSIGYVLQALIAMGWKPQLGQCFTTDAIANQLGIISKHQRLFKRLLEMLAQVGVLEAKDFGWQVIRQPEVSDPQAKLNTLLTQYPIANAEFILLGRCGTSLAQVLRGECDPLQLLFPENDSTTAQLYENSPLTKVTNILAQQTLVSIVEHLPTGRGLRILEIGAGTGGTTAYLLPHLPCEQTQYHFSDISISFTQKAQERFQDFPFVKYQVLDIEKDPLNQGFEKQQYDVIVAANVLHATEDLQQTLKHTKQLLAPQGILILLETTQRQRWVDLIFGLTPGWWRFNDLQLRPDYPLISAAQWQKILQETGFTSTVNLSPSQQSSAMVMLAQVAPPNEPVQIEPKHWLLFADRLGIAQQLAQKLDAHSQVCTLVFAGEEYEQLAPQQFKINPSDPQHYQKLLQAINSTLPLYGVVHCWSLDTVKAAELTTADLATASLLGCGSTLHLVQALTGVNFLTHPRLWLVTQEAVAITNLEGVAQSSLWGMARVIATEHPELNCVQVDLSPKADAEVMQALFEEMWFPIKEDHVAFRDRLRYVARLVRYQSKDDIETAAHKPLRFREDSTYLITGGMGGLGLLVAHWMVQQGARHLVLVGRSPASLAVNEQLQELEQAGAQVKVVQADVSDIEQIAKLLREIEQTLPPLRGIIHSVGVLDDGVIQQQNWQRFAKVLAPKVQGAWHLHTLTQKQDLDFFVMFSSIASLIGNPGQSNHAAANAFIDALAYHRQAQGLPGLSINWGAWSQIGAFAQRQLDEQTKTRGIGTFTPEQGLAALDKLLYQSSTQVAVMPINWVQFLEKSTSVSPLFANFIETSVKTVVVQHDLVEELKKTNITKRRNLLQDRICSAVAKVLGWQSEPIDLHKKFFELGMDSLTSLDLKNHLQKTLKCSLPINLVFEYPNVELLTDYLIQELDLDSDNESAKEIQHNNELPQLVNIKNSKKIRIEL
ncbi:MAG: type I polyketide synthase [Nostoc sp. DedQUE04]|uniref:type I polyketide synthase n=1 Tax=Nostoc sp. DedQUE04 TaxID=3075390 RepID=UPI002AD44940|nr:type I polyketide synthase [Nostoc sp. DedQUE04]MDZ8137565.1 type I polyketide synthase [Nostoc sp. DedQUE04]